MATPEQELFYRHCVLDACNRPDLPCCCSCPYYVKNYKNPAQIPHNVPYEHWPPDSPRKVGG